MKRLLFGVLALQALLPGSAAATRHGGSIRAFVTVQGGSAVALVNVDARHVVALVPVPKGSTAIAATIDGHRVLVVSPSSGSVTQLDGVAGSVTRVFRGFGRPEAVTLALNGSHGYVGSRYAYVTDEARGLLDVLDLARGRIVSRLPVGSRPTRLVLAIGQGQLWIAHRRSRLLTAVDATVPPRPRLVAQANAGGEVLDLAADQGDLALIVAYRNSGLIAKLQTPISFRVLFRHRVASRIGHLAIDATGHIWTTELGGKRAELVSEKSGRVLRTIAIPDDPTAVVPVGGWMAFTSGTALALIATTDNHVRITIPVGPRMRGLAFAVLG